MSNIFLRCQRAECESETVRQNISGSGNIFSGSGDVIIRNLTITSGEKAKPQLPYEPELVEVPAGSFWMGSASAAGIPAHEPLHQVELPAFLISKIPVTNAVYEVFVRSTKRDAPKGWLLRRPPAPLLEHPVTHVSWQVPLPTALG